MPENNYNLDDEFDYSDHFHVINNAEIHCSRLTHCPSYCLHTNDNCTAAVKPTDEEWADMSEQEQIDYLGRLLGALGTF